MFISEAGRKAETAARVYLEMRGYKILEQNFRRPRCEIDIIARKEDIVYFVEVKYSRNDNQSSSPGVITASKLRQVHRAANIWVEETKWRGEHLLASIEIAGEAFSVMNFVDNAF